MGSALASGFQHLAEFNRDSDLVQCIVSQIAGVRPHILTMR
jgi:hypothetical protein